MPISPVSSSWPCFLAPLSLFCKFGEGAAGGPRASAPLKGASAPHGACHRLGAAVAAAAGCGRLLWPPRTPAAAAGWAEARLASWARQDASWLLLLECLAGTEALESLLRGQVVAAAAGSSAATGAAGRCLSGVVSGPD